MELPIKDRTEEFYKWRERARNDKKSNDKREFLNFIKARSYQPQQIVQQPQQPSVSPSSFPNIFIDKPKAQPQSQQQLKSSTFSGSPSPSSYSSPSSSSPSSSSSSSLVNRPFCFHCGTKFGLFTSKITCDLCMINFCSNCIKKLSSQDITGVLREGQVKSYCSSCMFIVTREESNRKYEAAIQKSKSEPIFLIYTEISMLKRSIKSCLPNFEYLAGSITDFTRASPQNRETFLQVYDEVLRNQNELGALFKDFDRQLKFIVSLNAKTQKELSIQANMKHVYVHFLQQNLPKFKSIQTQILHLEKNTATNVYIVLCSISLDDQLHRDFWSKYSKIFQDTISTCRKDLFNATIKSGDNWDKHKKLVDDTICDEGKMFLNLQNHPSKEFEGTLLRKNLKAIKNILDQVNLRVKPEDLKASKIALLELYNYLSKSYQQDSEF